MENQEKKIGPFTLLFCENESMPGEHPCALYDEKRKCCALIPQPLKILIPEQSEKPLTWAEVFQIADRKKKEG